MNMNHKPLIFALALSVVVGACSGDDGDGGQVDDDDPTETSTGRVTTEAGSSTTQPSAEDEAAFTIVEAIAVEANDIIDELLQDPTVIEDEGNSLIERLRELHTVDSPTPDGVIAQLHELADNGQRERAAASGIFSDFGIYEPTAVDADTVRFRTCSSEDSETVDANGRVVARRAQVSQGVGEVRRVDGVWRIYGISLDDDRTLELEPGTANAGFCDDLYAEEAPS